MASPAVPYTVKFDKADVADLRARLKATRWPTDVEGVGWQSGAPLAWIKSLAADFSEFDFSAAEARLNQFPNFTAKIGATLPASKKKKKKNSKKKQQGEGGEADSASVRLSIVPFFFYLSLSLPLSLSLSASLDPDSSPSPLRFARRPRTSSLPNHTQNPPPPRTLAPIDLHFIHQRANRDRPAAPPPLPLLLLHGWPGSVVEFLSVVAPLADPGPDHPTAQAFDVVAPSLPGFGFSEAPREAGWGLAAMASCFDGLMTRVLRYERYCVQGGDWGSMIARRMALDFGSVPPPPSALDKVKGFFSAEKLGAGSRGKQRRQQQQQQQGLMTAAAAAASEENSSSSSSSSGAGGGGGGGGVVAIHQNMAIAAPRLSSPRTVLQALNAPLANVAPLFISRDEAKGLRGLLIYQSRESGYFKIQSTKPMTLGYGLSDSPVAALAWVSVRKGKKGERERERNEFFFFFLLRLRHSPSSLFSSENHKTKRKTKKTPTDQTGEVPR